MYLSSKRFYSRLLFGRALCGIDVADANGPAFFSGKFEA
jgi:hypothetical protein